MSPSRARPGGRAAAAASLGLAAGLVLAPRPAAAAMSRLDVGVERQRMPLDCEATSLALALRAVGVPATQEQVQARFPVDNRPPVNGADGLPAQWGDPYTNFVGNVYGSEPGVSGYDRAPGWGAFAPAVAGVARSYGVPVDVRSGWNPGDLYGAVEAGHPVLVWTTVDYSNQVQRTWTAWDGRTVPWTLHGHVVVLVGVDRAAGRLLFSDPLADAYNGTTMAQFERTFGYYGNMALVILRSALPPRPPSPRPRPPAPQPVAFAAPSPSPTPDPPYPRALLRLELEASVTAAELPLPLPPRDRAAPGPPLTPVIVIGAAMLALVAVWWARRRPRGAG